MKNAPSAITHCVRQVFRLVALATALAAPLVYADEYSDLNQLVRSGKLAEALRARTTGEALEASALNDAHPQR